jgi:4-hydroxyphenylpyruvate dioxygenase
MRPGNKEMGQHMEQHGDGVKDVAFHVSDAKAIYEAAVKNGAKSVSPPKEYTDEGGKLVLASVQTVCKIQLKADDE